MIKIKYKKLLFINLIFLFCAICIQPKVQAVVNITELSKGEYVAKSDLFTLVDSTGGNLSTNSHYEFLGFWRDESGKFVILWKGDKQAYSNHNPNSITIANTSITQIYEYSSFVIKNSAGETLKEFTENNGQYHYFTTYLDMNESFITGFNIVFDAGAGGYNINSTAKINFYVLVQHNVGGNIEIDWEQSIGDIKYKGKNLTISKREYLKVEYEDVNITYPNNSSKTEITETVDITVQDGLTKVVFNYDPSQTRDIIVNKIWDDNNNLNNTRPDKIRIYLTIDGNETETYYDLDSMNETTYTFFELEKYDEFGNIIKYGIIEKEINEGDLRRYKQNITQNSKNEFTIDNILLPDYIDNINISLFGPDKITSCDELVKYKINFSFSVSEEYTNNIVNFSIKDQLEYSIDISKENFFDGGEYDSIENTIIWNGVFDKSTNIITWSDGKTEEVQSFSNIVISKEISVVYKDLILNNDKTVFNNVKGETQLVDATSKYVLDDTTAVIELYMNIIINKIWKNDTIIDEYGNEKILEIRPDLINVRLYENQKINEDIEIKSENGWKRTILKLPKYDSDTQEKIEYSIEELDVFENYNSQIEKIETENEITFNITNEKINKEITFPVTGNNKKLLIYFFGILSISISTIGYIKLEVKKIE